MDTQLRLVHWYDTAARRIACGAPGQSSATKHARRVTCPACVALVHAARDAKAHADGNGSSKELAIEVDEAGSLLDATIVRAH